MSFVITLLVVIFTFAFFMRWMDLMAKDRQHRMKLLEEAVKSGNLDAEAREDLVQAVSGRRRHRRKHKTETASPVPGIGILSRFIMFVGWISMLVGLGFAIYEANARQSEDLILPAIILICAGFALVTYPFTVQVLEYRGAQLRAQR